MLSTNGHGPKPHPSSRTVSPDEQARSGYSRPNKPKQADLYRATPRRLAPSAGQKGSTEMTVAAAKRVALIRTEVRRSAQSIVAEDLFPLPKNGVLVGMACEEAAAPGHSRSLHLWN